MKRHITLFLLLICIGVTYGQGTADLMRLSQTNYSMGTARSAALGGTFTSLGADGISMSVNPAGLAMYHSSEVSITPYLCFGSNKTDYSGSNPSSQSNTKFAIGNFSFILSDENSQNGFTLGIGYNRLNDFSSRSNIYGHAENTSIGQMYMEQMNGIPASEIGSPTSDPYQAFYKYVPSYWNGIMAYQAGLINPTSSDDQYNMAGIFNYNLGDTQYPQGHLETSGALHEYSISGAYNIKNKLYVGMSLNIQNMVYREIYRYSELTDESNSGSLDNFTLKQDMTQNSVGFNVKVGVTLNLNFLRIGLAYHSPTWGNFKEETYSNLTVYDKSRTGYGFSDTPILRNNYNFTSAHHILAGISTTIAKKLIIAADYELVTYGSMKYRSDLNMVGYRSPFFAGTIDNLQNVSKVYDGYRVDVNSLVKDYYKSANNFRFALEYRPIKRLFLRAGYASYGSMYKDRSLNDYGKYQQISGGIGFRFSSVSIDLAYVYGKQRNLPSTFFKYIADDGYTVQSSGIISSENSTNTVLVTIGIRPFKY